MIPRDTGDIFKTSQDAERDRKKALCPKGFVGTEGFGLGRKCRYCGRDLDEHVPVAQ